MSETNIRTYLTVYKKTLEAYLERYLSAEARQGEQVDSAVGRLYAVLGDACFGGKCIRGGLVKLGYEVAAGVAADERILPVSAAFEILQAAVLSHDDIIDRSPMRRGRDSVWRQIAREADDVHYGVSQAICLGDLGIFMATRLIAESAFPPENKINALSIFSHTGLNTIGGEMLDVVTAQTKDYADEERILRISRYKTAWYTVVGPFQIGAAMGGASRKLLDAIEAFGLSLGVAFQLKDDVLGVLGSEAETGKSNTSDIAEGKVTLLIHHALGVADENQVKILKACYGRADVSDADRADTVKLFHETGTFEHVKAKALSYLEQAKLRIPDVTSDPDRQALLHGLSDMMFDRKH